MEKVDHDATEQTSPTNKRAFASLQTCAKKKELDVGIIGMGTRVKEIIGVGNNWSLAGRLQGNSNYLLRA